MLPICRTFPYLISALHIKELGKKNIKNKIKINIKISQRISKPEMWGFGEKTRGF